MSAIALTVSMLALVAVLGLWIGNWKIYGVGLGIGGVLFGGIIVGHFAQTYQIVLNGDMLHFIQEFGLILFVYTIGIQVGPGFFSSLRVSGLRLNCFAILMVVVGGLVTAIIHKLFAVPLPIILGGVFWCGNQYTGTWCGSANSYRFRFAATTGQSNGDGLRHGVSIWYLWHFTGDVADSFIL